jgi:hypothetical protein
MSMGATRTTLCNYINNRCFLPMDPNSRGEDGGKVANFREGEVPAEPKCLEKSLDRGIPTLFPVINAPAVLLP